jgi:tRNA(Ile)-lysidine synthase
MGTAQEAKRAKSDGRALQILYRVRTTLRRYGMLAGGETVVVAVSGGPDSMALLHLLRRLRDELNLRLHVVHVDHGLHRASEAHARFVRHTAAAWGISATVCRVGARLAARRGPRTLEEAARALRYAALARVARRVRASHVAVAHTADDQAETVLLWLVRGAGSDGLAGMPAIRPMDGLRIIRPLLDLWRQDVVDYLKVTRVPYRQDPTNRQRRPLRNRVRRDLLPHLAGYNSGIKAVLRRLADQVADDAAFLDRLAVDAAASTVRRRAGRVMIDAGRLRALPASLQRRVVHHAFSAAGGNIRALAFVHIERLREMAARRHVGEQADLPGLQAERRGDLVVLTRASRGSRRRTSG